MLRLRNESVSHTRGDVQRLQRNVLFDLFELPRESRPRQKARSDSPEAAREAARLISGLIRPIRFTQVWASSPIRKDFVYLISHLL